MAWKRSKQIKKIIPDTRIVVITVSEDDDDIFKAIKYGAQGYLTKNLKEHQLMDMIEGVSQGEAYFSGIIASKILREFDNPNRIEISENTATEILTQRVKKKFCNF